MIRAEAMALSEALSSPERGSPSFFSKALKPEDISGLWPRCWVIVGPHFSREEIKGVLLERGFALSGHAISNLPELALRLLKCRYGGLKGLDHPVGSLARQDILKFLVSNQRISGPLTEIKRLKRQAGFFKKLDQAIQAGRMCSAHPEEEAALTEKLIARLSPAQYRPLRDEVKYLAEAYVASLPGADLWDIPRILEEATRLLSEQGWPESLSLPQEILYFSIQSPESLESAFCEALERIVPLKRFGKRLGTPKDLEPAALVEGSLNVSWEQWHTFDDAALGLAGELKSSALPLASQVVLIPDSASLRRSLKRALERFQLPLVDERDPNFVRSSEAIKWALLPLEMVAYDFERSKVVSWLRAWQNQDLLPDWISEIAARGIRQGLKSYSGGRLTSVHSRLAEISSLLGGRKSPQDLSEAHLRLLRQGSANHPERRGVNSFFEELWEQLIDNHSTLQSFGKKRLDAPLRHWLERLKAALDEAPPPPQTLRASDGVQVFRLHQCSLTSFQRVIVFGLPPSWLSVGGAGALGVGDYWFSEREREVLSAEFAVRSGATVRGERLEALRAWFEGAAQIKFYDSNYEWDGREREGIEPVLREIGRELRLPVFNEIHGKKMEKGSHPLLLASHGAIRPLSPRQIELPALPASPLGPPQISATALDLYSRCGFQALAYQRWKLKDTREPDFELWPHVKGDILHHAVKALLASRNAEGQVTLSVSEALDQAWQAKPPQGLLPGERSKNYIKSRLVDILRVFLEKEREFRERAQTTTLMLDNDICFRFDFGDFVVAGTPDRIEKAGENLWIIDYKTSSSLPHGSDMLDLGYRLQLPFYALAAQEALKAPVAGVQFVELTKKGSRGSGMFFTQWNGKGAGKLTALTNRSKSLLSVSPEEAWERMREQILRQGKSYVSGHFAAAPKRGRKECDFCSLSDFCGLRRMIEEPKPEGEPHPL